MLLIDCYPWQSMMITIKTIKSMIYIHTLDYIYIQKYLYIKKELMYCLKYTHTLEVQAEQSTIQLVGTYQKGHSSLKCS